LKPIQDIAANIKKQNDSLIGLITKIASRDDKEVNNQLYGMITAMVAKNNGFIEQFKGADYTKSIDGVSEAIAKRPVAYEVEVTKRSMAGFIETAIIKPIVV